MPILDSKLVTRLDHERLFQVERICKLFPWMKSSKNPAAVAAVTEILFLHIQGLLPQDNPIRGGIFLALRQVEPGEGDGVFRVPVQLHVLRRSGRPVKEPIHSLFGGIVHGDFLHAAVVGGGWQVGGVFKVDVVHSVVS